MKIYQLKCNFVIDKKCVLPTYKGMMWRGIFGNAYRSLQCRNMQERECYRCRFAAVCEFAGKFHNINTYSDLADSKYAKFTHFPPKFVFFIAETKTLYQAGEEIEVFITFANEPVIKPDSLIEIFENMKQFPLDKKVNAKVRLKAIIDTSSGKLLYENDKLQDNVIQPLFLEGKSDKQQITIKFLSHCRISNKKALISYELDGDIFARRMIERLKLMNLKEVEPYEADWKPQDLQIVHKKIRWEDIGHYSNRQHNKLILGGFVGSLTLQYDNAQVYRDLERLQYLHIGTNAQGGYGKYEIVG